MKHNLFSAAIFACAMVILAGCYKNKPQAAHFLSEASVAAVVETSASERTPVANQASTPDDIPVQWIDIKDFTFEKREQFFSGFAELTKKVDAQISELVAKRAKMDLKADTKDWDFAMKEMNAARTYLIATGDELRRATPETWDQTKSKVAEAWARSQEAYSKVKSSTTI